MGEGEGVDIALGPVGLCHVFKGRGFLLQCRRLLLQVQSAGQDLGKFGAGNGAAQGEIAFFIADDEARFAERLNFFRRAHIFFLRFGESPLGKKEKGR